MPRRKKNPPPEVIDISDVKIIEDVPSSIEIEDEIEPRFIVRIWRWSLHTLRLEWAILFRFYGGSCLTDNLSRQTGADIMQMEMTLTQLDRFLGENDLISGTSCDGIYDLKHKKAASAIGAFVDETWKAPPGTEAVMVGDSLSFLSSSFQCPSSAEELTNPEESGFLLSSNCDE